MKDVPSRTIAQLKKIQKKFIWKNGNFKLKHATLYNKYEQRGLKNVDIFSKITSLQCSRVKRPCDDSFHTWKVIPLFLMKIHLGKNFVFHSNLIIKQKRVEKIPEFYQEILTRWGKYLKNVYQLLPLNVLGIMNI